ncbi:MAG: DotI/IcmL family type IV secretion protein [Alphaproteobacteria bacterium]|nr:DotI/IcmL family type IV secretion protein [Alphaproteobacteria bacterium]
MAQKRPTTAIKPEQVYKVVFHPSEPAPVGSSAQFRFARGLVTILSYVIALLVFCTFMVYFMFADTYFYHFTVLDRERIPERLATMKALDTPNLTRTGITNMAMNVATEVLTFGFNNADERLLKSRRLFTEEAWLRFAKAYLKEGRLDKIKLNQQVLTNVAVENAVIIEEGPNAIGEQQWVVQVPTITTYQAGKRIVPVRSVLQITFIKASTLEHPEGVAIDGWQQI